MKKVNTKSVYAPIYVPWFSKLLQNKHGLIGLNINRPFRLALLPLLDLTSSTISDLKRHEASLIVFSNWKCSLGHESFLIKYKGRGLNKR